MPPRRTSLQVDVSRDLYIVCAFMYQGMPHQQAQAFTGPITHKKPYADCGAAFHCSHGRLLSALVSSMARRLLATTSRIRNEEKKETKKIARGIFRSLAPLLGTAGSLSDCGLNPTLPESDCSRRWFFAPLFWLHMFRARPIHGVCLLSQPFQCPSFGCA